MSSSTLNTTGALVQMQRAFEKLWRWMVAIILCVSLQMSVLCWMHVGGSFHVTSHCKLHRGITASVCLCTACFVKTRESQHVSSLKDCLGVSLFISVEVTIKHLIQTCQLLWWTASKAHTAFSLLYWIFGSISEVLVLAYFIKYYYYISTQ